jgi:hypothetical protein
MNQHVKPPKETTFAEAFCKLQAAVKPAIKDATNPAFRSKYADLGAVWEAVRAPLTENGFGVIQAPQFEGDTMYLETILLHQSGEKMTSRYPLRPIKQDPQGFGSAITYAKRYALSAMLGVVADEDDDGNAASGHGNGQAKPAPQTQREAIHNSPTMPVADPDVEEGVKNWCAKEKNKIAMFTRLPDLLMWKDEREAELHRLFKKAPPHHKDLMAYYQQVFDNLSKKEMP